MTTFRKQDLASEILRRLLVPASSESLPAILPTLRAQQLLLDYRLPNRQPKEEEEEELLSDKANLDERSKVIIPILPPPLPLHLNIGDNRSGWGRGRGMRWRRKRWTHRCSSLTCLDEILSYK